MIEAPTQSNYAQLLSRFEAERTQADAIELQRAILASLSKNVSKYTTNSHKAVKTHDWGEKYSPLEALYGERAQTKAQLENMRHKYRRQIIHNVDHNAVDYNAMTKRITNDTVSWVQTVIDSEINKLGPPPTEFSMFSMGSMPRGESGIYTDLEVGIILKDNTVEAQRYFRKLTQNISDRIYLLGEHPSVGGKGMRLDEAENSPPHLKFAFRHMDRDLARDELMQAIRTRQFDNIPFEGSEPLMLNTNAFVNTIAGDGQSDALTHAERRVKAKALFNEAYVAARRAPEYDHLNNEQLRAQVKAHVRDVMHRYSPREHSIADSMKCLSKNIMHIYGDQSLYNEAIVQRDKRLEETTESGHSIRQQMMLAQLKGDMASWVSDKKYAYLMEGKLGDTVDIKRHLYRPVEQVLTNLGFYYNVGTQNTTEIVDELVTRGLFSASLGDEIKQLKNYLTGLRLKQQCVFNGQGYHVYTNQAEFDKDKQNLIDERSTALRLKQLMRELGDKDKVEEAKNKIASIDKQLKHFDKLAPGVVLTNEDVQQLNEHYIPLMKQLGHHVLGWMKSQTTPLHASHYDLTQSCRDSAIEEAREHQSLSPGGMVVA